MQGLSGASHGCEVSVVMPCLNEADTLESCIAKAQKALADHGIDGEVIVADNGSTDGSVEIARRMGARVVPVAERGYGNALAGGFAAARGRFLLMGDADGSYDWLAAPAFVEKLREGHDLVQGCRLPAGGGTVLPGAMPPLHRWIGNPGLSFLVRRFFKLPIHDVYCGLRGLTAELFRRLKLRCGGMEFATEMMIKAQLRGAKMAEIPITLHPDGRVAHPPHLRTFRDGWRTLHFFLMMSPRWLFLYPGAALVALGAAGYVVGLPGLTLAGVHFEAHTLLVASLALILGYQSLLFAVVARLFADLTGLLPLSRSYARIAGRLEPQRGLAIGAGAIVAGLLLVLIVLLRWSQGGFGDLDYGTTMRWVIPGVTLTALGFQTILTAFLVSLLQFSRR